MLYQHAKIACELQTPPITLCGVNPGVESVGQSFGSFAHPYVRLTGYHREPS